VQAPLPHPQEAERLADLYDYQVLDTPIDRLLDEVVELAAAICDTSIAAVTLIDRNRQCIVSAHGIAPGETGRDVSVCGHAILERSFFEVPDMHQDARFVNNELLERDLRVRFYGGSQLTSPQGHNLGMLCVMDATPRQLTPVQRRAMQQLADVVIALLEARRDRSRLEWFGTLMDRLQTEISVIDAQSRRYLHANAAALAPTGLELPALRGMTPPEAVPGLSQAQFEESMQRLDASAHHVHELARPGLQAPGEAGPTFEVRWERMPLKGQDVVVVLARDVSERKTLERMKDELVSLINHELRTPLTSIRGAVKLLEAGAGGVLPPEAAKLLGIASQGSDRLLHVVNDLLDLDRMASRNLAYRLEPLSAAAVLAQAAQAALALAQDAQVHVVVVPEAQATAGLQVVADAQRLQQMLDNLLSNALKFAPAGSTVTLGAQRWGPDEAPSVRLDVTDHGPGVPAAFRARIFQRFAQADNRTTRAKGGSGLGLSIVKAMAEQMNGSVDFESQPGLTTFHITLPGVRA
jgi:PAS domain S-box-containing protein